MLALQNASIRKETRCLIEWELLTGTSRRSRQRSLVRYRYEKRNGAYPIPL